MIYMLDPGSKYTLLLIWSTGLVNNETPFFNFVNNVDIQDYWKVQEYNGPVAQYNITQTFKTIRKLCGNLKTMQLKQQHKQKIIYP